MIKPINRNAVIISPKQPFLDMLESLSGENIGKEPSSLERDESTIYLLEEFGLNKFNLKEEMEDCFKEIYIVEVEGWFLNIENWNKDITWEVFTTYFNISYQSFVNDTSDDIIEYELH